MSPKFLFLDECYSPPLTNQIDTTITSISGLLVPIEDYPKIRDCYHKKINWSIKSGNKIINTLPPVPHGSNMLPEESEERRLQCYNDMVDLAVDFDMSLFRVGYFVTPELINNLPSIDKKYLDLCWSGMLFVLQPYFKNDLIFPIFELANKDVFIKSISQPIKLMGALRETVVCNSISIENSENLAEPFYASKNYSVITSIIDTISYLLMKSDLVKLGKEPTAFEEKLLKISSKIKMTYDEIKTMELLKDRKDLPKNPPSPNSPPSGYSKLN